MLGQQRLHAPPHQPPRIALLCCAAAGQRLDDTEADRVEEGGIDGAVSGDGRERIETVLVHRAWAHGPT